MGKFISCMNDTVFDGVLVLVSLVIMLMSQ